jgi:hypothetical protein
MVVETCHPRKLSCTFSIRVATKASLGDLHDVTSTVRLDMYLQCENRARGLRKIVVDEWID